MSNDITIRITGKIMNFWIWYLIFKAPYYRGGKHNISNRAEAYNKDFHSCKNLNSGAECKMIFRILDCRYWRMLLVFKRKYLTTWIDKAFKKESHKANSSLFFFNSYTTIWLQYAKTFSSQINPSIQNWTKEKAASIWADFYCFSPEVAIDQSD